MSSRSDYGMLVYAYDVDSHGVIRTTVEVKRRMKAKRLRTLQKQARRRNRV